LDPFLSLQHSIASGLSDAELGQMKFLCRDKVGKGKLESVRSALELLSILIEQQHITPGNLRFLRELLERLKRHDLVSQLNQFEEGGGGGAGPGAPDDHPDEREKSSDVICENIGKEWKKLMRELRMPDVLLDRIEADRRHSLYEQLVQGLREWQRWKGKDAKVDDLIKALRRCRLNLVADRVEE
ncbi:FADD protein, partial [Pitta sordida]|nr:FADD protein [Pitta sordida]